MAPTSPAATEEQIEALLCFMDHHRDLARGVLRGAEGRVRAKRLWEDLCSSLNSLGGCPKTVEQWQRVWADKKHLTKKAAAGVRRSASATGAGPLHATTLSHLELRILGIIEGSVEPEPKVEASDPAYATSSIPTPVRQPDSQLPEPDWNRILELEEQRLQADIVRNEQLFIMNQNNQEIKSAIVELCNLVREYITRND